MLVLTRRPGEAVKIDLLQHVDPQTPVGELFACGPIEVVLLAVRGRQVKLGLRADARLLILRDELYVKRVAKGQEDVLGSKSNEVGVAFVKE